MISESICEVKDMEKTTNKLPLPALITLIIGGGFNALCTIITVGMYCWLAFLCIGFCIMAVFDPYSGGFDTVVRFGDGRYHIDKLSGYYDGQEDVRIYGLFDVTADINCDIVDDVISYFESADGKLYVCGEDESGAAVYALIDLENNSYEYHNSTDEFAEKDRAVFELDNVFTVLKNRHEKLLLS